LNDLDYKNSDNITAIIQRYICALQYTYTVLKLALILQVKQ